MKTCRQCHQEKEDKDFHIRQVVCRQCQNARRREKRKAEGYHEQSDYKESDFGHVDDGYSLDILKL